MNILASLAHVTTATLTTVLLKKGLRNVWLRGTRPLRAGQARVAGRAFTLRFIPPREDQATPESWAKPTSTRGAIEAMPEGCIAVVDARGVSDAGIFGDILCARMRTRGVAALVTDGVVRDLEGVRATGLPVWYPDDVVVADDDGAIVVPSAIVDEVTALAVEQEQFEAWIMQEVGRGTPLPGLYPANSETRARYEAYRRPRESSTEGEGQ